MPKQPYLRTEIYSIYKPSLGLVKNEPTSILNPRASIDCQNVRYENGRAFHRTGYSDYGSGAITGIPLKFFDNNGTMMLATTTNIYHLSGATWTSIASTIGCDIDHRISINTIYNGSDDKFYAVWGSKDYLAKKWDGTTVTTLASDVSTWKPKVIVPFQYRLLMFNIDVGGTNKPIRMSYSNADDISDWTTASVTGSRNLVQGRGSEIMNAVPIKGWLGVYKDRSITLVSYVGGDSIFANKVAVDGIGLMAQDAIVNLGTKHIFLGNDYNIYQWEGGGELIPIGNPIRSDLITSKGTTIKRCFAVKNNEEREVSFFLPASSANYATKYFSYNWESKTWSKHTIGNTTGAGEVVNSDNDELSLIGTYIGSTGVAEYMYASNNEDGSAISSYFTTPDITFSEEHISINKIVKGVVVDAAGGTTLSFQYSTDSGQNWSTIQTETITSYYNRYKFDFTTTTRKIRFKFSSTALDAAWAIRYIGIEYKDRERK